MKQGLAAALTLALASSLASAQEPPAAQEQLIDAIAAQVGSEVVLLSTVMSTAAPIEARARQAGASPTEIISIRNQALERAIERALIRQVVQRAELEASDGEVDDAINGIAEENGISARQLRESVEGQGMPYAIYRERIRGEIEHSKVMNGIVASRVRVSDEDIRQRFDDELGNQQSGGEEFSMRHIMVTEQPGQRSREEACDRVELARVRIDAGDSFPEVASQISETSPERGGAVGYMHESELSPWIISTLRSMKTGEISEVIETPHGCNLFQLIERREFQPQSLEDAREKLHGRLFNERMEVEYTRFIDQLRSEIYIDRKEGFGTAGRDAS